MILVAILFIALGALIKYAKIYDLIAGYNTMSEEEKARYDIEALANLYWKGMLSMAAIIAVGDLIALYINQEKYSAIGVLVAVLLVLPIMIYKANNKPFKR